MAGPSFPRAELALDLPDLAATAALARALAAQARPGDVIGLAGALGTGKTSFARAFLHAMAQLRGGEVDEVPSPTFTLVQVYDFPGLSVCHFDFFRLQRPEEAYELGIEEAFATAVSLIEWPERVEPLLPEERLELRLEIAAGEARRARLTGTGAWAERLEGIACHA
jgi:tRNA threonylcarbamoyladenosine biosynthesis protein TsaE